MVTGRVLGLPPRARTACHVSNGEDLLPVDRDGRYALPFAPDRHRFMFVIPPDGYTTVGRFWYTTDGGARIPKHPEFNLRRTGRQRTGRFEFLQITDCHLRVAGHGAVAARMARAKKGPPVSQAQPAPSVLRRVLGDLVDRAPRARFIVVTGDITDMGQPEALRAAARVLDALPLPVYPIFGGHDGNTERLHNRDTKGGNDHHNAEGFCRYLAPPYYAWHWGGRHFVSLVSEPHFLDQQTRDNQAAFIAADLERFGRTMPVTVCSHKHPYPWSVPPFRTARTDSWVHGHFHSARVYDDEGIRVFSTPPPAMGALDQSDVAARRILCDADRTPESRPLRHTYRRAARIARPARGSRVEVLWRSDATGLSRTAKPCLVGETLFAGTTDHATDRQGSVIALDLATGATRWQAALGESVEADVIAHADTVIAVTQTGRIARLAQRDGRVHWRRDMPVKYDRWVYGRPALLEEGRAHRVIVGGTASAVCLDAQTGRVRWEHAHETTTSDAMGRMQGPIAYRGRVFFAGHATPSLLKEAASGRTIRWIGDRRDRFSTPVTRIGDALFMGSIFGTLQCTDAFTGKTRWTRRISDYRITAAAAAWHDAVVIGTAEGVGRYSLKNGRRLAFRRFGQDLTLLVPNQGQCRSCAAPCPTGPHLLVASGDGHVNVLAGKRLDLVERFSWPEPITGAMAPAPNGRVVFVDTTGRAVCIRVTSPD